MAVKNIESRKEEYEALKGIDGIDANDILAQIGEKTSTIPPVSAPTEVKPPKSEAGPPPDATGILKEIFGDQFTSVDDLKKIDIPTKLKEVEQLRQLKQSLEDQNRDLSEKLSVKPKSNYADDDIALFNEFVRDTKIKDWNIFSRINKTDVATMDFKDAILLSKILEEPELIAQEPRLRKQIEKTYNVDPEQLDEDEVELNQLSLAQEGLKARRKIQEFKSKLKIPEPGAENDSDRQWTPEQQKEISAQWDAASKAMGEKLSKIPVFLPNTKEPFINFTIPEEMQKAIMKEAAALALDNRMEIDEKALTNVAKFMYSELIMRNFDSIAHSIFEKARSLSEKEVRERYHNPTPLTGGETPPIQRGDIDEEEESRRTIFDAELKRG